MKAKLKKILPDVVKLNMKLVGWGLGPTAGCKVGPVGVQRARLLAVTWYGWRSRREEADGGEGEGEGEGEDEGEG